MSTIAYRLVVVKSRIHVGQRGCEVPVSSMAGQNGGDKYPQGPVGGHSIDGTVHVGERLDKTHAAARLTKSTTTSKVEFVDLRGR